MFLKRHFKWEKRYVAVQYITVRNGALWLYSKCDPKQLKKDLRRWEGVNQA